jgi:hypothetical protein
VLRTLEASAPYAFAADLKRTSRDTPAGTARPLATPATESPPADLCVAGSWTETFHEEYSLIEGERVRLTSTGRVQRFNADGTGSLELGSGNVISGTLGGKSIQFIKKGKYTFTYTIDDGKITYDNVVVDGTITVHREGFHDYTRALQTSSFEPDNYICSGDTMRQSSTDYTIELRRNT